jgi:hypothetical protein
VSTSKTTKALAEQVDVLLRVQQEVIATALVVLSEGRQEVVDVEVVALHLDVALCHLLTVHVAHILIEGVEARHDVPVRLYQFYVGVQRTAQLA